MRKDVKAFCASCDVCQKTKSKNFTRYGLLHSNAIPQRPFEAISMDLIVNLPMSDSYNAIWVVVDRLSKYAIFIPTTTGLIAEGFTDLFVRHVACKFGIPEYIITDRDPRWTAEFWKQVAAYLRTEMWLASSHHPQHDGQTEIVNRQLETMLRAYVAAEKKEWARWLPLLEHARNNLPSSATGYSPYFLLFGFSPRDSITGIRDAEDVRRSDMGPAATIFWKSSITTLEGGDLW